MSAKTVLNKDGGAFFTEGKFWRAITNFWTAVILVFIPLNFFSHNAYGYLVVPIAVLYTGALAIYVGTKEFERWHEFHESRHPGEWFVILWTIIMFGVFAAALVLGAEYAHDIHSDVMVGVYIAVITLFAFTQKSKSYHRSRRKNKKAQ